MPFSVIEKLLKMGGGQMTEKEKAAICLFCTEAECKGETKCFVERQKKYRKNYYAERRKGEKALDYICNLEYSKAKREALKAALEKYRKDNLNEDRKTP